MKILFIAPNYYPHIGGVEKHIRELSAELIKDGHVITIIVPKHEQSYVDYEKFDSMEIIRLTKSDTIFTNRLYTNYQIIKLFDKFKDADIIHFHDYNTMWCLGLFIYPLLKIMRKKIFITFHGWEGDIPPKKYVIVKRKICEKLANANISVGHFIQKWYGTKADIISYGGVHKVASVHVDGHYALFLGRLAPDTGIFCYIEAWKKINQLYPDLKLVICGDGISKFLIEKYVHDNDLKHIEMFGFVTNTDEQLANAKIVFTSGYLGILEAFSYKKPVIALYDNELKRDYLEMMPGSSNMMWIAQDSDDLVRCIGEALIDTTKVKAAFSYSLQNSWEKVKFDYYSLWSK